MSQRHINELKVFSGNINLDDDIHTLQNGELRDARNIQVVSRGNDNMVVNDLGMTIISGLTLPSGTNRTVSSVHDPDNNSIIFFNHNSFSNHGIYEYNYITETYTTLYL